MADTPLASAIGAPRASLPAGLTRQLADDLGTSTYFAKSAVANESLLPIRTANLPEHAMSINMELRVLIGDGPLPGNVAAQSGRRMEPGTLRFAGGSRSTPPLGCSPVPTVRRVSARLPE